MPKINSRVSHRHKRLHGNVRKAAPTFDYAITDGNHRPDLRGEFAGVRVAKHGGKHVVRLTERAARFYLDSGSLVMHSASKTVAPEFE